MDSLGYFRSFPSRNTVENYQNVMQQNVEWPEKVENFSQVDVLDRRLFRQTALEFETILESQNLCKMWSNVFGRIKPKPAREGEEKPEEWLTKKQSCMVLAKRAISLLKEGSIELAALVETCRITKLFCRIPNSYLDDFYREMLPARNLHEYQLAPCPDLDNPFLPRPPKSCWRNQDRWTQEDWPENYMASWDHFLTIFRGIVQETVVLHPYTAVAPAREPIELWKCSDWTSLWEVAREGFLSIFGIEPSELTFPNGACARCTFSELSWSEENCSKQFLVDVSRPFVVHALIRSGVPLFAVFDWSEIVTGKCTEWKKDVKLPYSIPLFHLASQFGKLEILKVFFEDEAKALRTYYSNPHDEDTPYQRALMNRNPSVLILFLEEARQHPDEPLAKEIENSIYPEEKKGWTSSVWQFFQCPIWRRDRRNYLLLACVSGDVDWAKYLIGREEERVMASVREEDRKQAAEIAVKRFVNALGVAGAPKGTPVELAVQGGHWELVKLLFKKGAEPGSAAHLQIMQEATKDLQSVMGQWHADLQAIRECIQTKEFTVTEEHLKNVKSLVADFDQSLKNQAQVLELSKAHLDEHTLLIQEIKELVERLEQRINMTALRTKIDPSMRALDVQAQEIILL